MLRLRFTAFIDSLSRHRETGHAIFIKLPDFLSRESVNRERSFSHTIFRVPVAFPRAKRGETTEKERGRKREKETRTAENIVIEPQSDG